MNKFSKALKKIELILKGRSDLAFLRKKLRSKREITSACLTNETNSQYGQDKIILEYFENKRCEKIFVEFGAHDGITNSNTYLLETQHGWNGLLIEPLPEAYNHLKSIRSCKCINACITSEPKIIKFMEVQGEGSQLSGLYESFPKAHLKRINDLTSKYGSKVKFHTLQGITLEQALVDSCISRVDYMSIDTEGSELEIIKSFPFHKFEICVLTIENNYHGDALLEIMDARGYELRHISGPDEIYFKKI